MNLQQNSKYDKIAHLIDCVRDIRKLARHNFMKKMKEHDIDVTIEMIEVLEILWQKDNINQQEIVDKTNRNRASITSLIDNMTTRGLVQRKADPNDRRVNLIALTADGINFKALISPLLEELYEALMVIPLEDIEEASRTLEKIYNKMTQ